MSITLSNRELSDVECLLNQSYAPLKGFLSRVDYHGVVNNCRLVDGTLWPIPIVLPVKTEQYLALNLSQLPQTLILRDETYLPVASMRVTDCYQPDLTLECQRVYGTTDTNHPQVNRVIKYQGYYLGGEVTAINPIQHYDFLPYRLNPAQVKEIFVTRGWTQIVAFQTRNPLHRSHIELTKLAMSMVGPEAKLLLHPVVGDTQECDVDYVTRCRCYQHVLPYYQPDSVQLALLPYSMRMGGPREALLHAIVRKNYGCTHFIIGRDHAGPSSKSQDGQAFYMAYEAQDFVRQYERELGLTILTIPNVVYIKDQGYDREDRVSSELKSQICEISGTKMRQMLKDQTPIPEWYTYPEIAKELQLAYDQTSRGLCVYLVGLSGSGKSVLAQALRLSLSEIYQRPITILDADVIRTHLSKGLGFSKEDRSTNVRRIGYVASEIVRHGGLVIVANIAPYQEDRQTNRQLITQWGRYLEIFVDTPLEVCEQRDVKGLYQLARTGQLKGMTGIDDPFERPQTSDLVLNNGTIAESLEKILDLIRA